MNKLLLSALIFSSLLVSGCGGGSGGGGSSSPAPSSSSKASSSAISSPSSSPVSSVSSEASSSIISSASSLPGASSISSVSSSSLTSSSLSSAPNNCFSQTDIQHLGCLQGEYPRATQYAGAAQSWTQVVISEAGDVSFIGATELSFSAYEVAEITADGSIIQVTLNRAESAQQFRFFTNATGGLRDIEYERDEELIGIGVTPRAPLGDWVQNPNTLIGNGIAGTLNNQLFLLYRNLANNNVYADERGLKFIGENETGDSWVIQIDTDELEKNIDYTCQLGSNSVSIALKINGIETYSSVNGGQCRVQLTTIEMRPDDSIDYIDGVFVAELPSADRTETPTVVDGRFRFDVN
jgi:hypothetical protein